MDDHKSNGLNKDTTTQQVRRLWNAWMSGECDELENLLDEKPGLLEDQDALAELVYSEYWLRKQLDGSVSETEYLQRFPQIAEILKDQFAVGKMLLQDSVNQFVNVTDAVDVTDKVKLLNPRDADPQRATLALKSIDDSTTARSDSPFDLDETMAPEGFQPLCVLGVGGMGVVIKALQLSLNREVAIKSLKAGGWVPSSVRERLRKEAIVVGKLRNSKVVQVYEVIEERGRLFLVLEYVPGKSLAREIAARPIDPRRAARYLRDIALAIEAAHKAGFLHRDIKPTNILLSEADEIKVTDFGLARATELPSVSISGEVSGTPAYMAPEQIRGDRTALDVRTDVYGLGATLYEMLTGRPPFVGSSTAETLHQVLHAEPTSPKKLISGVHRDLESICLRCLEKSSEKRYASVTILLADIERFLSGKPTLARPVTRLEKARRWIKSNPSQFISSFGLVCSLVVLLVATTWYFARVSNMEAEGVLREQALRLASSKEQLTSYFSKVSTIQNRTTECLPGWTWQNERDLRDIVDSVPGEAEESRLRELAIQTLDGFDLRKNSTVTTGIDPYGLAWSPDGHRLVVGENVTRTLPNKDEAYVLYSLGRWPERTHNEILIPAVEPEKIAGGLVEGIRSLMFLPDSNQLVVGCRSGWIQIFDFESGEVTAKWKAHLDWCYSLAFDPSRNWILSGCRDSSISAWDAHTHQLIKSTKAIGSVKKLHVTRDLLVALSDGHEVFSLVDFQKVGPAGLTDNDGASMLHLLSDQESLVLASRHRVFRKDIRFGTTRDYLLDRVPFTRSPSISNMDSYEDWSVVSGIENALFLNNRTRREVQSIPMPGAGANYITFDRQGAAFWVANNHSLHRYDQHLPELWTFTKDRMESSVTFQESGINVDLRLMVASHQGFVQLDCFSKAGNRAQSRIELKNIPTNSTLIEQLFNVFDNGLSQALSDELCKTPWRVHTWDSTAKRISSTEVEFGPADFAHASSVCLSLDAERLWICDIVNKIGRLRIKQTSDGTIIYEALNSESAERLRLGTYEDIVRGSTVTIALSDDHKLSVFDSTTCKLLQSIELGSDTIPKVAALSHNETTAFVGAQEGHLLSIDIETGRLDVITQGNSEITSLAASLSGVLAIGYHSGDVDLWSTAFKPAKKMCRLSRMSNAVAALEFSRDGNQLALVVQGEQVGRLLDWNAFRTRLNQFHLDWEDDYFFK